MTSYAEHFESNYRQAKIEKELTIRGAVARQSAVHTERDSNADDLGNAADVFG